jgi:hypothetical protein
MAAAQLPTRPSRWADHVAQLHRAERATAAHHYSGAPVPPAQFTVRRAEAAPSSARVLQMRRVPVQLELFDKSDAWDRIHRLSASASDTQSRGRAA